MSWYVPPFVFDRGSQFMMFLSLVQQGVATQCLKSFKCSRANAQYWANVLLKFVFPFTGCTTLLTTLLLIRVNVKLGGINVIPDPNLSSSLSDPAKPTIVMGRIVVFHAYRR
jgi:eukaryotic translation initiation factor 2C